MSQKIQDNESIQSMLELTKLVKFGYKVLDKLPLIYKINPEIKTQRDQAVEILNHANILLLPDEFNNLFSKDGWVCYGGLSQRILEEVIYLGSNKQYQEAKQLLINYIDEDKIDFILKKCASREHFKERLDLFNLLKIDYLEERYHACIPLLLALIDGLANDISKHLGFFAENSDLELYDSITSHGTGLPFLKTIMNTSRTKTITEIIHMPYRNGILHGRDLNFANKEVASKCWWVLDCLIDWADEKQLNKQPKPPASLREALKQHQSIQELSKRIDLWKRRPTQTESYWKEQNIETLNPILPEYALFIFLGAWKEKQWGKMTPILLHNISKHLGKAASEVKNDYKKITLLDFHIINSEDQTPSNTQIYTYLEFIKNHVKQTLYLNISVNYANSQTGDPELRNEPNCGWYILQASISALLFH
ncbi:MULTISPECIES: hypothetical protein [Acinetobacter]|uniref:DUF4209 domain-containing protein n=1 Tax=Acinetobacter entericus TaxID=2989714 RepID=A0ABT3NG52_9GAMM|nr:MULTISPECIES: hypothetical protein [Acinetobacter]MCW8038488.1 hypothetical protein [Acinetobacter entericus]TCB71785.1 hypothetical protein E0H91_15840 [Acinetobacter sp. ANC 4177]